MRGINAARRICFILLHSSMWPCVVCGRRVGSNSVQCKCSCIKDSKSKLMMKSFICTGCVNPVTTVVQVAHV